MNPANAVGFLVFGIAMWALPVAFPNWFPTSAIDGSNTRAIWLQLMGGVQGGIGALYVIRNYTSALRRSVARSDPTVSAGAESIAAEHAIAEASIMVAAAATRVASVEPVGSVTLHGEHAELWRAFNQALRGSGHARQLAARLAQMAEAESLIEGSHTAAQDPAATIADDNIVLFPWSDEASARSEDRELVAEDVA